MEVSRAELSAVAATIGQIPEAVLPEIAFAGKSNVGKSSLINTLVNRKSLARTSSQPGKTRTINFYSVQEQFMFVDLPGYGYAKTARAEQERFSRVIDHYLTHRDNIRYVFLLVDIRHEPGANDVAMVEWMNYYGYEPVIIATKADKLSRNQQNKQLAVIRKGLGLKGNAKMIAFSALSKQGKDEIWQLIESEEQSQD
jgi:GTP-binding protein